LNSFGAVVAISGAADQRAHYDHPALFPNDHELPPYAITVGIPLVNFTDQSGTTRVWPGSHHIERDLNQDPEKAVDVPGPLGSIYLFDYRVLHAGTKNISPWIRPLLYLVYAKPWFRDSVNFQEWKAIDLSDEEWQNIPPILHRLFRGTRDVPLQAKSR
jgi:ectoine hydroxylase-related dioxygenase (phytanoyl-CoA dioxygenase family)